MPSTHVVVTGRLRSCNTGTSDIENFIDTPTQILEEVVEPSLVAGRTTIVEVSNVYSWPTVVSIRLRIFSRVNYQFPDDFWSSMSSMLLEYKKREKWVSECLSSIYLFFVFRLNCEFQQGNSRCPLMVRNGNRMRRIYPQRIFPRTPVVVTR